MLDGCTIERKIRRGGFEIAVLKSTLEPIRLAAQARIATTYLMCEKLEVFWNSWVTDKSLLVLIEEMLVLYSWGQKTLPQLLEPRWALSGLLISQPNELKGQIPLYDDLNWNLGLSSYMLAGSGECVNNG